MATDMSPAYISAVLTHLPNAVHVFDHFHVIKLFNESLTDLRRELSPTKPPTSCTKRSSRVPAGCS